MFAGIHIPKDLASNVRWRQGVIDACHKDPELAASVREACRRDIILFLNLFGWLIEPRGGRDKAKLLPFCTWRCQDRTVRSIIATIEEANAGHGSEKDVVIEKSRDMGATWMVLYVYIWEWLFFDRVQHGLVSRDLELVRNIKDSGSLFRKISEALKMLPSFILRDDEYDIIPTRKVIINHRTQSEILAYPATGEVARGDRKRSVGFDEAHSFEPNDAEAAMSAAQHATPCRILFSTLDPKRGEFGPYYNEVKNCRDGVSSATHIVIDWKEHPEKRLGLYQVKNGRIIEDDPVNNPLSDEYRKKVKEIHEQLEKRGYTLEGRLRSPWYNNQCLRPSATPYKIAAELDRDFAGTTANLFDPHWLDTLASMYAREPVMRGNLAVDPDGSNPRFTENAQGDWYVYCPLDDQGRPEQHYTYCLGADIAAGSGGDWSSYSSLSIINANTGQQVALYRNNRIKPHQLAYLAVGACLWFKGEHDIGAYMVPEVNGPLGAIFRDTVIECGYSNVYYRQDGKAGFKKTTKHWGFFNADAGQWMLTQVQKGLDENRCIITSKIVYEELKQYFWHNQKIVHKLSVSTDKEDEKGKAHGDCAISTACAWVGVVDLGVLQVIEEDAVFDEPEMTDAEWAAQGMIEVGSRREEHWLSEFDWD